MKTENEGPMTEEEFRNAYWQVQLYGNAISFLVLGAGLPAIMLLAKPAVANFGDLLRKLFDEAIVGLIGGLVIGLALIPFLLIVLGSFLLVNRQLGVRCPNCRRSVTLCCSLNGVLTRGQCCLCGRLLFEVQNSV